ncbi:hypothetical protein EAE96_011087 [Botrytis aclada]|nr:hypothetical protein EAE96_011087 [Botrytis aclada]
MNTSLPPPLRSKLGGKRDWTLKLRQDLTPAVIGSQEPNKMRIALISVTEAGVAREVYYDRGYGNGEPFDWNDASDIFLLNDWRRENIRKYTPRDLGQMEHKMALVNQGIENEVVQKPTTQRVAIQQPQELQTVQKQTSTQIQGLIDPNRTLDDEFITMVAHGNEIKKFRAQKRRAVRQVTPRLANGRRQHSSNRQGPIEFLPVDLERLNSLTPKQQRRDQNLHVKNWSVIFEMMERSLDVPSGEIGVEYNL